MNYLGKIRKLIENPEIQGKLLRGVLHGYWEFYFENRLRILYTPENNKNRRIPPKTGALHRAQRHGCMWGGYGVGCNGNKIMGNNNHC